jgi:hypothetical protein
MGLIEPHAYALSVPDDARLYKIIRSDHIDNQAPSG